MRAGLSSFVAQLSTQIPDLQNVVCCRNVRKQRGDDKRHSHKLQNARTEGARGVISPVEPQDACEGEEAQDAPDKVQGEVELHAWFERIMAAANRASYAASGFRIAGT